MHAQAERARSAFDPPISFEESLARPERRTISRRDLLRAGAIIGTGVATAACTSRSSSRFATASTASASASPHDARIVVVGAGLAGTTAAYRLWQAGVPVRLFEARDRIGGRCWTARGFAEGQTAEHGGEFIDTRHIHIRRLARELGLTLNDLWKGYTEGSSYPRFVEGSLLDVKTTRPQMERISAAVMKEAERIGVVGPDGTATTRAISAGTSTPAAVELDQLSMQEWLEGHVDGVLDTPVGQWLDEVMAGWYGLNMSELSSLNWIDFFVIPAPGADERWHVRGGNDQITSRAAAALPREPVLNAPLVALRRRADGPYELVFDGVSSPIVADLVILTLPFSTLRQVDVGGAGFGADRLASINELAMGNDVKLLLQYDQRPASFGGWSGGMERADPDFDTWESSVDQPGRAGLITVYAGGRTGASWSADRPHGPGPDALVSEILGHIEEAVPGTVAHFNGRSWADLWTRDPWTKGAYAAFAVGQYTRFWGGTAQPDGNVHFAGEATSTYSQGYLNGGVESGDRAAMEVLRKLGLPVPPSLSALPH